MYFRLNIKGQNCKELSKTCFKKMPGKLQVNNERIVDASEDLEKYKKRLGIQFYRTEDGSLLKKKLESIEVEGLFTKYEDDEIEYTAIGISDNETFMQNFNSFINPNEYSVSEIFLTRVKDTLRSAFTYEGEHQVEIEVTPVIPKIGTHMIEDMFNYYGFVVELTAAPENLLNITLNRKVKDTCVMGITIRKTGKVNEILQQAYILLCALDSYHVSKRTVTDYNKLLKFGEGWLENSKYLDFISNALLNKYSEHAEEFKATMRTEENSDADSYKAPKKLGFGDDEGTSLHKVLIQTILSKFPVKDDLHIVDYGCGEASLITAAYEAYKNNKDTMLHMVGIDSDSKALMKANRRLGLIEYEAQKCHPKAVAGSLYFTDSRLENADVAVLIEVIEHNARGDLEVILDNVFLQNPHVTFITSPNREYNQHMNLEGQYCYDSKGYRHPDHRFEFSSEEFRDFFEGYIDHNEYAVEYYRVGKVINGIQPTDIAVVTKRNWSAPSGYNSYPDAVNKYRKKMEQYQVRLDEFHKYQTNPVEYMQHVEQEMEAKYQKDLANAERSYEYQHSKKAQRVCQEHPVDRFLIGQSYKVVPLHEVYGDLTPTGETLEEALAKVKKRVQFEPGEPIKPSKEGVVTGQYGSLFRPKENLTEEEKFIKRNCRTREEIEMYKFFLKDSNSNYRFSADAFYKWVRTRHVSSYADYQARLEEIKARQVEKEAQKEGNDADVQ